MRGVEDVAPYRLYFVPHRRGGFHIRPHKINGENKTIRRRTDPHTHCRDRALDDFRLFVRSRKMVRTRNGHLIRQSSAATFPYWGRLLVNANNVTGGYGILPYRFYFPHRRGDHWSPVKTYGENKHNGGVRKKFKMR